MSGGVAPARFVKTSLFEVITGYTPKAVERKIHEGVWMEGREFRRAPDNNVLIDLVGYYKWVERGPE